MLPADQAPAPDSGTCERPDVLPFAPLRSGYRRWLAAGPYWIGPINLTTAQSAARASFDLDAELLRLDRHRPCTEQLSPGKATALEAFAKDTLGAKRCSQEYLHTLARILHRAVKGADAFELSGRDESLGTRKTLRTLQRQLLRAGFLVQVLRNVGHGFVGPVFVWAAPATKVVERLAHARACVPASIQAADVPF